MSIRDMDDLFGKSSQMSFLGSSPYTKKYDTADNSSNFPVARQQSTSNEEKQENVTVVKMDEPSLQVEEIQEEERDQDRDTKYSSTEKDQLPDLSQRTIPPREYEMNTGSYDNQMHTSWRKSLSNYPSVTAEIRNNLLRCRDELFDIVSDLCDENKHLQNMYDEIRQSPLAEEIKQEYEDAIAEWSEKFRDLQNMYNSVLDQNHQLQSDLDIERRENEDLRNQLRRIPQLEQDLKSAIIRRDVLEKELRDTQNELDYVQSDKRKAEAQVDSQKKELRSLKIELNTLRAELNEGVPTSSTRTSRMPDEQESVVLYNKRPALPKRETQSTMTAIALYDYEGNSDFNSAPMRKGDKMTVLKFKDTRDWVLVQLDTIQTWEPVSYLSIQNNDRGSYSRPKSTHVNTTTLQSVHSSNKRRALAIADFEGLDHSEMSIRKGEIIQISKEDGEWLLGAVGARKGWIPLSYVEFM